MAIDFFKNTFNPTGQGTMFGSQNQSNSFYDYLGNKTGLTDEGMFDLTSALGDKEKAPELIKAFLEYQGEKPEQSKIDQMMGNSGFIMGLSLMQQAASGKNLGAALMPAAETTQGFITNQELRAQNKRLMKTKETGQIVELLQTSQDLQKGDIDIESSKIGIDLLKQDLQSKKYGNIMLGIDANSYYDKNKLNMSNLETDVAKNKVSLEQAEIILKYADKNQKIDYAFKEKNLKGLDIDQQQALENLDASIIANDFKEHQFNKSLDKDKAFEEYVDSMNLSTKQKAKYKAIGIEGIGDIKDAGSHSAETYNLYDRVVSTKSLGWIDSLGVSDQDEIDIKNAIKEQILFVAQDLAGDGTPSATDIKKAEQMVIKGKGFTKNGIIRQFFGGGQYDIDVDQIWDSIFSQSGTLQEKAKGGTVVAGEPYLVGEHGPEVIVPHQTASVVSNKRTPGGYTWEEAIIDSSEMLMKIKQSSGLAEAKKALKKFRPDLYI